MLLHQIFCQQQIADRRDDCSQQNTHGAFTLLQQTSHERQRQFQVPGAQCVAQFENYPGTR